MFYLLYNLNLQIMKNMLSKANFDEIKTSNCL